MEVEKTLWKITIFFFVLGVGFLTSIATRYSENEFGKLKHEYDEDIANGIEHDAIDARRREAYRRYLFSRAGYLFCAISIVLFYILMLFFAEI